LPLQSSASLKKIFWLLILLLAHPLLFSQSVIRGTVISKDSRQPLPSVSVYLNNTSLGATSNDQGIFILRSVPPGKFRLVASSIGYENFDTLIDSRKPIHDFTISLQIKAQELEGFAVSPPDPDGWKKWGALFTDLFIGTVPKRANNCKLMNPEVIKFRLNANNTLTANAREPLLIENYALGYEIKYKLDEFEYDLNSKSINYSGYALFTDLALSHPKRASQYARERWETYQGSLLHFMRAVFADELKTQGFEMRSLGKIPNAEKLRAKQRLGLRKDSLVQDTVGLTLNILQGPTGPYISAATDVKIDSTDYFKKMLLQPDSIISHQVITADSIGFAADSTIAGLYFPDSLEVSYLLKGIPARYRDLSKDHKHETYPISQFVFPHKTPIFILNIGYYYKPYDLKITGYWAWSECMSTRLPYDYSPNKK